MMNFAELLPQEIKGVGQSLACVDLNNAYV